MPYARIFNVPNMSINVIRENKILAKISGFTVVSSSIRSCGLSDPQNCRKTSLNHLYPRLSSIQPFFWKYQRPQIGASFVLNVSFYLYEGCSNMNASSFITFFTYMLRQNVIPVLKELFVAFKMAPNIRKHLLYFSSYRPLYKSRSNILKFFWSKLQHTFWCMCRYSAISL